MIRMRQWSFQYLQEAKKGRSYRLPYIMCPSSCSQWHLFYCIGLIYGHFLISCLAPDCYLILWCILFITHCPAVSKLSVCTCLPIYLSSALSVTVFSSLPFRKEVNVTVKVSPVSPWYKRYHWGAAEQSVLVTAQSDSSVCGLLVLQNAKVRRLILWFLDALLDTIVYWPFMWLLTSIESIMSDM